MFVIGYRLLYTPCLGEEDCFLSGNAKCSERKQSFLEQQHSHEMNIMNKGRWGRKSADEEIIKRNLDTIIAISAGYVILGGI